MSAIVIQNLVLIYQLTVHRVGSSTPKIGFSSKIYLLKMKLLLGNNPILQIPVFPVIFKDLIILSVAILERVKRLQLFGKD